jgi:hypothetical protein
MLPEEPDFDFQCKIAVAPRNILKIRIKPVANAQNIKYLVNLGFGVRGRGRGLHWMNLRFGVIHVRFRGRDRGLHWMNLRFGVIHVRVRGRGLHWMNLRFGVIHVRVRDRDRGLHWMNLRFGVIHVRVRGRGRGLHWMNLRFEVVMVRDRGCLSSKNVWLVQGLAAGWRFVRRRVAVQLHKIFDDFPKFFDFFAETLQH